MRNDRFGKSENAKVPRRASPKSSNLGLKLSTTRALYRERGLCGFRAYGLCFPKPCAASARQVSIVATGMGVAMIDFVVREHCAVLRSAGCREMAVLRLGTCGALQVATGTLVVSESAVMVRQEPDAWADDAGAAGWA